MSLKVYSISTDVAAGEVNMDNLHAELINAGCINDFTGICITGDELCIDGDSFSDESACDLVVQNHEIETLDQLKVRRGTEVDIRTDELIGQGFAFDSKQFSLSLPAQKNWLGLKVLESMLTWPVAITTINDNEYQLAQANVNNFVGAGQMVIQTHLNSGRALKVQISSAANKAAVDAIVDNR